MKENVKQRLTSLECHQKGIDQSSIEIYLHGSSIFNQNKKLKPIAYEK